MLMSICATLVFFSVRLKNRKSLSSSRLAPPSKSASGVRQHAHSKRKLFVTQFGLQSFLSIFVLFPMKERRACRPEKKVSFSKTEEAAPAVGEKKLHIHTYTAKIIIIILNQYYSRTFEMEMNC